MKTKFILLFILVFILSSCTVEEDNVSVFIYNYDDPYVNDFAKRIDEKSDEKYDIFYSQNSQVIQNQQVTTQIEAGADLMIVNPVDRLSAYVIIEKLETEDIPVIFFNREPLRRDLDLWEEVYYIGAPAEQPGIYQADMIMELFGNNPNNLNDLDTNDDNVIQVAILKGEQGHQDAEARTESVIDEFQAQGFTVEVLTIKVANWNKDNAKVSMQEIIDEYADQFEVIISNNDAMAIGAIETLISNDYFLDDNDDGKLDYLDESWVPVIGVDGLTEAIEYIESGHMYGTVINDSEAMVEAMIDLANAILNNTSLDDLMYPLVDETYIWINYRKYTNE